MIDYDTYRHIHHLHQVDKLTHTQIARQLGLNPQTERFQFHFDIDSMSRAAFLCSFIAEIKARRAHDFYIRYDKNFTVDECRSAVVKARAKRSRERALLPEEERDDVTTRPWCRST